MKQVSPKFIIHDSHLYRAAILPKVEKDSLGNWYTARYVWTKAGIPLARLIAGEDQNPLESFLLAEGAVMDLGQAEETTVEPATPWIVFVGDDPVAACTTNARAHLHIAEQGLNGNSTAKVMHWDEVNPDVLAPILRKLVKHGIYLATDGQNIVTV
ncbi:hypothetical protein [Pseudomonas phage vB_PaeM_RP7]|uniref:Uncharacterized protein n=1 Tax=Pseudomonas phage PAP-JP TaxID=2583508 RepID=A0A5C1K5B1_9CAUD|nr:hypothetical protein PAPJP_097 [Pseudomonas phage PAP-JP]UKH48047.1 MAG: hypothetical protein [Pseudomonas phage RP4]WAB56849.1 hypothetical protein [Pseudomonas phage vB_PaeM_RP15]WAB56964.1 hypothetical protein [Pseudomonas phage vB_PaeM_RP6]WAB57127.1 hypothetical protein [Pseudomonas phage vB_PaeM_RP7]WAB57264.1 hypothetical protein [Pseudomonas phage vB_PaeM_RP8]WAB57476.1 hypothetical protein [Pseudomonas phage vB_PaeM_RP9]WAB57591.1 hypothetical protein [Pseudomonas phage vB_PaeM_R